MAGSIFGSIEAGHELGKSDVGLNNVDNTSDANKPISNATQAALDAKQDEITFPGGTTEFLRADASFAVPPGTIQLFTIALTGQTTTIGPTTITSAGSQLLFSYTLLDTANDATAGTIQLTVNYTDDQGATSQAGASISLAAATRDRGVFVIQRASGNVTYTVTLTGIIGSAQYALYATLQRFS